MNRILVFAVALAVVALLAFGVVVFTTGGQRLTVTAPVQQLPDQPAQPDDPAAPDQPDQPSTPVATTPEATARFDAWAKPLRDRGLTITTASVVERGETLTVKGFTASEAERRPSWEWTIETVQVFDKEMFHLQASGNTSLHLATIAEGDYDWSGKMDGLGIAIEQDGRGVGGRSMIVRLNGLTLAGAGDSPPLTLADGQLRLVLQGGTGLLPPGTQVALRLSDMTIPPAAGTPVGSKVKSLTVGFTLHRPVKSFAFEDLLTFVSPGIDGGVRLGTFSADWGPLHFLGDGFFNISATGRLGGRFEVEVTDPLSLLDAIAAAGAESAQSLATTYGALLLELGRSDDSGVPFTLAMDGGAIALQGASRGLADIVLGVAPRVITGISQNASESVSADLPQGSIRQQ